ncbi:MAG: hypothetical protein HPAVJP_5730 [Candidatus Hepatoplasma vulgare]|nr:MAG: hypothetical protein HPAVJP_5730 [Candidatus Hepatoplasma sp.]
MNKETKIKVKTENKKSEEKKKKAKRKHDKFGLYYSLFSIIIGLLLGMFLLALFGYSPFSLFIALFQGNFSSIEDFENLISTITWMTIIGLSMVVSFRAGFFNIGISAQMVGGGLAGFLFATLVIPNAGRIGVLVSIFLPILVGVAIALLISTLKTRFGVHEVVSSIMLNWVVYWFYRFFSNPNNFPQLYPSGEGASVSIPDSNSLRFSFAPDSPINIGLIILIIILPTIWFLYKYTTWGVKQTILGQSKGASIYSGINYNKETRSAFMLSGGLAGLAGSCFYLGTNQNLPTLTSDLPAEAFNGITIALIGFNNPLGAFGAAIFMSLFENSKSFLNIYANQNVGSVIMSIILWFMAISNYVMIVKPHQFILDWINKENKEKDKNENDKNNEKSKKVKKDKNSKKIKKPQKASIKSVTKSTNTSLNLDINISNFSEDNFTKNVNTKNEIMNGGDN